MKWRHKTQKHKRNRKSRVGWSGWTSRPWINEENELGCFRCLPYKIFTQAFASDLLQTDLVNDESIERVTGCSYQIETLEARGTAGACLGDKRKIPPTKRGQWEGCWTGKGPGSELRWLLGARFWPRLSVSFKHILI